MFTRNAKKDRAFAQSPRIKLQPGSTGPVWLANEKRRRGQGFRGECVIGYSAPGEAGEHVLVDLLRIAEQNRADVAHVFWGDALHVAGRDGARFYRKKSELRQPPSMICFESMLLG